MRLDLQRAVRITVIVLGGTAAAPVPAVPPVDAGPYSLANPTPPALRRPMSADRPDFTESPYTVDAGALQLELSFIDYAKNGSAETTTVAPMNLKIGLLEDVDIQLVANPFVDDDNGHRSAEGFGDAQVRLKINLFGNNEGPYALAIMPFISLPTGTNDLGSGHVEGGIIVPYATALSDTASLGLMFEADFVYDDADAGYDTDFVMTAALGIDLTDRVGLYVEKIVLASTDTDMGFRGILGTGATYALTDDLVLDIGVNIGLTGDVDDVNVFSGVTIRF